MLSEKERKKQIREKHYKKKHDNAPWIECGCGCGEIVKSVDKWGRQVEYANGHGCRKYPLGTTKKERNKIWYQKNKEKIKEQGKKKYEKKKDIYRALKIKLIKLKNNKCIECGLEYNGKNAVGFDFHHRDPDKKIFGIAASSVNCKTEDDIMQEAKKCDLMCRVCHSILHFGEY